jgi:hypothetical protein
MRNDLAWFDHARGVDIRPVADDRAPRDLQEGVSALAAAGMPVWGILQLHALDSPPSLSMRGGRKRYRRGRPSGSRRSDHSNTATASELSGSLLTRRWRELDSNPRSPSRWTQLGHVCCGRAVSRVSAAGVRALNLSREIRWNVRAGEAPEMPEAVSRGDLGHCRPARVGLAQAAPRQMHAAQQQVSLGTHPQVLLAA